MPSAAASKWTLNPDDLRVPSAEEWDSMTVWEQQQTEEVLCMAYAATEQAMSQGEMHINASVLTYLSLRTHFGNLGRSIYIAADMAVLYPHILVFSPDLFVVRDVDI